MTNYDIYDIVIADSYKMIFNRLAEIHQKHLYSKELTLVVDTLALSDEACYAYHVLIDACGLLGWTVKIKANNEELQTFWNTKKFLKKLKRTNLPKDFSIIQIVNEANQLLKEKGLNENCGEIYRAYWEENK